MVIRILDHVKNASTYEDGDTIYKLILDGIKNGAVVKVSFKGISSVPSAFVNAAFIRLLDDFSFDEIKNKLIVVESTKYINDLIKSRFDFVVNK